MQSIQFFDDKYLEQCKSFSTDATSGYLDNFRLMQQSIDTTHLISIRISKSLLAACKTKSELHQFKYQT